MKLKIFDNMEITWYKTKYKVHIVYFIFEAYLRKFTFELMCRVLKSLIPPK